MANHFRKGDRVQMDVTYPQRVGTVQEQTRPDDIRASVLWDGSTVPHWEWRHLLVKAPTTD